MGHIPLELVVFQVYECFNHESDARTRSCVHDFAVVHLWVINAPEGLLIFPCNFILQDIDDILEGGRIIMAQLLARIYEQNEI